MSNQPPTEDDRQALFEDLFGQLHYLHTYWRLYVTFFGSREATEIVSRAAPYTFGHIQKLLIDAIILRIDQLLESATTGGKQQASIARLVDWIPPQDVELARELTKRLDELRLRAQSIAAHRDRLGAHRDLDVVLQRSRPGDIKTSTVRHLIGQFSAIMTILSNRYHGGMPCDFHPDEEADAFDADVFLARLAERQ
jgi:hypothetical protein